MGHVFDAITYHRDEIIDSAVSDSLLVRTLDCEIESFREGLNQTFARMPPIHLAYLHVRRIADGYLKPRKTKTEAIINNIFQTVTLLINNKGIYSAPWMHHITGLATVSLVQMADLQLHTGATPALRDLRDGLDRSLLRLHKEKTGWDVAISAFITKRLEGGSQGLSGTGGKNGLGQLADAAIGNAGATDGAVESGTSNATGPLAEGFGVVSQGYLTTFEQV